MRLIFSILSIAYVFGIFLFADSSMVSDLSTFNPYSLLHIPLYGILTVLLILCSMPLKFNPKNLSRLSCSESVQDKMRSLFHRDPTNPINWKTYFLLSGGITLFVAIADEIHQAYVPGRDASVTDVLLDMVGISLALFLFFQFLKIKTSLIRGRKRKKTQ